MLEKIVITLCVIIAGLAVGNYIVMFWELREKVNDIWYVFKEGFGNLDIDEMMRDYERMKRELDSKEYKEFLKGYNCGGYYD